MTQPISCFQADLTMSHRLPTRLWLLLPLLSGCAASLHPLASNDIRTEAPDITGTWRVEEPRDFPALKPGTICTAKRFGKGMYNVQMATVDGKSTAWEASVVRLGDDLYLDVQPELKELKGRPEEFLTTRLHGIFLLEVKHDQMALTGFHQNDLHDAAREAGVFTTAGPGSKHHFLASETPKLQEFFRKYGAEIAQQQSQAIVLKRVPEKATPSPATKTP
jgi:hypothetical protein